MRHSSNSDDRRGAVVLAHDLSARGGAERVAVVAASVLRDLGFRTTLATGGAPPALAELGRYFDVDLSGVRLLRLRRPRWAPTQRAAIRETAETIAWTRALRSLGVDVQLNCMFGSAIPGVAERNLYYVHFPHDPSPEVSSSGRRGYLAAMRAVRTLVAGRGSRWPDSYDSYLANSSYTAGFVDKMWNKRAEVVYPPCALVPPGPPERQRWILGIGRFQARVAGRPHKRQDAMIEAFSGLPDLHRGGWQLHLAGSVGSAQELDRLRYLADGLPVHFHPDLGFARLQDLYQQASIYWHAQGYGESLTEAPVAQEHFGITTVEAMSAGLLPVVYHTGGPAEVVHGVEGAMTWTALPDLAEATRRVARFDLTTEARMRASCVRRARDFDVEHFRRALVIALGTADRRASSLSSTVRGGSADV